jgi:hypothetical protein
MFLVTLKMKTYFIKKKSTNKLFSFKKPSSSDYKNIFSYINPQPNKIYKFIDNKKK